MQTILLSGPGSGFMFRETLETLFRLRRRIVVLVALILALGVTLALIVNPKYHAASSVLVMPGPEYTIRTPAGANQTVNQSIERTYILATEVAILTSRDLHRQVLQDIGLGIIYPSYLQPPGPTARAVQTARRLPAMLVSRVTGAPLPAPAPAPVLDPLEQALSEFGVDFSAMASSESNTISLGFAHKDAQVAAKVLSTLERLYLAKRQTLFADSQSNSVQEEAQRLRSRLEETERQLADFKVAHDISNFPTRQEILLQAQGSAEKGLMEAQSEVEQQQARAKQLRALLDRTPKQITAQDVDVEGRNAALRSNLDALLSKRADLSSRYQAGSAPAQTLDAQIKQRQDELAKGRGDRSASGFRTSENPVYTSMSVELTHAEAELRAAQARQEKVAVQIHEVVDQQKAMNKLEREFSVLERQRKQAADDYADAAKILAERRIIEQVTSTKQAGVRILSEVVEPILPAATRKLIVIMAAALAVLVAVLMVLLGNYFRRGFLLAGSFERDCGIPVLVVIPDMQAIGAGRTGAVRPL